jgi:archaellum component FlaC
MMDIDGKEEGMNEKEFREVCERLARLEKTVGNGLREDITELKEAIKSIQSSIEELATSFQSLKTTQNIQWWLISLIIVSFFVSRFVK